MANPFVSKHDPIWHIIEAQNGPNRGGVSGSREEARNVAQMGHFSSRLAAEMMSR